jgi:hypothetical protein
LCSNYGSEGSGVEKQELRGCRRSTKCAWYIELSMIYWTRGNRRQNLVPLFPLRTARQTRRAQHQTHLLTSTECVNNQPGCFINLTLGMYSQ